VQYSEFSRLYQAKRARSLGVENGPEVAELYFLTRRQCLTDGVKKRFYQGFAVSTGKTQGV
jgi:hypothetical protein